MTEWNHTQTRCWRLSRVLPLFYALTIHWSSWDVYLALAGIRGASTLRLFLTRYLNDITKENMGEEKNGNILFWYSLFKSQNGRPLSRRRHDARSRFYRHDKNNFEPIRAADEVWMMMITLNRKSFPIDLNKRLAFVSLCLCWLYCRYKPHMRTNVDTHTNTHTRSVTLLTIAGQLHTKALVYSARHSVTVPAHTTGTHTHTHTSAPVEKEAGGLMLFVLDAD